MSAACPSCRAPMSAIRLPRKLGGEIELDQCFPCQGIWFDGFESLQLAPAGVVELFRRIHEHGDATRLPLAAELGCPRCAERLIPSQDRVKSGRFNYHRCGQQHGRFITFGQFMIEKGFVRQLSASEIGALAVRIGVVRCNGCGAPVDIRKDAACPHCRAPIAILDARAVETALAGYARAARGAATNDDPEALAEQIMMRERERGSRRPRVAAALDADVGDLLLDGVSTVWEMLS